jgi:hypothetical protein
MGKSKEKEQSKEEKDQAEMEKINKAMARFQKATKLKVLNNAKEYFKTIEKTEFTRGI